MAGRYELLSCLADDLAHEIKNPLHAMVINLEVLKRRIAGGNVEGALDRVGVLEQELRRVNELVHRLLLLIRPDREGVQLLDVDEVVGEIVPLLELQARVARVDFEYRPIGVETRAPIQRDVLAYALIGLAADALSGAGEHARLTVDGVREDGTVRLRVGPAGPGPTEPGDGSVRRAGEMFGIADNLLREAGARADRQPETGGDGVYTITLPLAGGA
jgi:signal transduction histidine kinase